MAQACYKHRGYFYMSKIEAAPNLFLENTNFRPYFLKYFPCD